ncbi:LPS assembly protein LptD [Tsuneonella sp. CC-YZS046]|uniref:LPS-assembly protein LptD n=1 Tax=Tsuneonella sp. CC-YZS046 TaxID=3042152 RepID=UPI002D76521F|nr:LPS assembly protein LptD [Tsuneonella sp. CC-YZS046]WRO65299.1 LPS assembly protein LptD [Tsuneonella sp. CC-YZS046]
MLPGLPHTYKASRKNRCPLSQSLAAICLMVSAGSVCTQAQAQSGTTQPDQTGNDPVGDPAAARQPAQPIAFEADQVEFNSNTNVVTASGEVILRRGDQLVEADSVSWNRDTGRIVANGDIRFTDEDGNKLYTESLELTDELRAGAMSSLLIVFAEGGRLAAQAGDRADSGTVTLTDAAYSGCAVVNPQGCEKKPSWRVLARRVVYDPDQKKVRFYDATLELFGLPLVPLPGLSVNTDGRANSGLMIPSLGLSNSNGLEVSETYYMRLANNRDLALTAFGYSKTAPMARARYRALTENGAYQLTGYITRSSRIGVGSEPGSGGNDNSATKDWRGYFAGNGRFQIDPQWSVTASVRVASDRTFLRRYDISRDDRLRSTIEAERIDDNSYLSIAGWATQTLRVDDRQGLVPLALPVIDYRRRLAGPVLGGRVELQANSLAITRFNGQDTRRAFASARWDMRRITTWGQEITLTALVRGDIYHSDENSTTATAIYRGNEGWEARGVGIAAVDVKWPLLGSFLGGTQVLTPRVQIVATPRIRNLAVPNEDARAIDLEDSNLFALNRFPGYDRVEEGVRFTYGIDWQLDRPGWRIKSRVGQSYRLTDEETILPDGTGLSGRFSDFVGRTEIRFRDFVSLTHRFRVDKDSLAVRRNEFDATVGSKKTYIEVSYLRLNRDISSEIEDLQDREELRLAGRVAIGPYWSLFGAGVFNLTDRKEDPKFTSDGFEALRTRLGVAYQDDCLELGVTWRRDYQAIGDARKGNTFQVYFALRNIGI